MINEKLRLFLQSTGFITAAQAADIAGQFGPKAFGKNDFLLQAGKVSDDYFFLSTGVLRTFASDPNGPEVTTAFYASGQVVFEVASCSQRPPSQKYWRALTACEA